MSISITIRRGIADLIAANQGNLASLPEQVTLCPTRENPLPVKAIAAIIQHNTSSLPHRKQGNQKPCDIAGKNTAEWGFPP
jgi:ABC-type nitrate/sulfonate/bicarbonate transport system substrate-binding protein